MPLYEKPTILVGPSPHEIAWRVLNALRMRATIKALRRGMVPEMPQLFWHMIER